MTETPRFLAMSENLALIALLRESCIEGGFLLEAAGSGAQGFKSIVASPPDLLFLDIGIHDIDGLSWLGILREMREGKGLPVVVTGENLGPEELARSFELGAEDCIVFRHCDPRELSARIRAVLRRRAAQPEQPAAALSLGPVELDPGRHRCYVGGKEVELRPREFELLEILMRKAGRVLSRPYLLESVWGMSSAANTRARRDVSRPLRRWAGKPANGGVSGGSGTGSAIPTRSPVENIYFIFEQAEWRKQVSVSLTRPVACIWA